ncbi:hypothetical protein FH972_015496 [Carpinus fangiana]|uniref:Uncharacterized protein n=1 Tax=Carpinus fangiana TaxID=176857 RepID=A0A5N6RD91_9ROSI|nr:hypothetical protein FH972_015496 [Carpinus fangiana]
MENSFLLHASGDAPPAQVISFLWMLIMICQRGVAPTLESSDEKEMAKSSNGTVEWKDARVWKRRGAVGVKKRRQERDES